MLKIEWDQDTCQHAGVCVNRLPDMFKVEDGTRKIGSSRATKHQVRDVCAACPSGALTVNEG